MLKKPQEKRVSFDLLMPRPWHGMTLQNWWRFLARGDFRISPTRIPMAAAITAFAAMNSAFQIQEEAFFGHRSKKFKPPHPPLFIIGHWRTGTTMLHELLVRDPQFTYPSTMQVMAPNHFLSTSYIVRYLISVLSPQIRPMDNMEFGPDQPQEDEFALCNLGAASPYLGFAWPRKVERFQRYLDFEGVSPAEVRRWEETLQWFLGRLALGDPRQAVLKSPTHTARVGMLHRLFPDAKFVHIVRDPYKTVPSTLWMWKTLQNNMALEPSDFHELEDAVFDRADRMYRRFEQDRRQLPTGSFCEIRFEDLVREPARMLGIVYDRLGIDGFDKVKPSFENYFREKKHYRRNRFYLSARLSDRISQSWGDYIERYEYEHEA